MRADMLEGVEEAFAYIILKDKIEKEDYAKKVKEFDVMADSFQKTGALKEDGLEKTYAAMQNTKAALVSSIDKLHSDFEKKGSVTKHEVREVEDALHRFDSAYFDLFDEYMKNIE